jgi:cell division septation protein DedD
MQKAEGWPDAVSLDMSSGVASPVLDDLVRSLASTPVLLLAVGPLAQRGGWAAQACITIAEALATTGRVVVADLSLDRPELHDLLGTDNTEGLTDVFLFGASLEHVTGMLPAHSFELIPAAAFTPDTEEILTHRRWGVVFEELAAAKTKLLLYLPITTEGTGAFSDRVGHTVVLADRWEAETVRNALSADAEIMGFVAPPETVADDVAPSAPEAATVPEPDIPATAPRMADGDFDKIRIPKDSAREALIADLRARQRAALQAPAPVMAPLPDEVDIPRERAAPPVRTVNFPPPKASISEPSFATTVREKPRRRVLLPALLVVFFVSSAAAGWHIWRGGSFAGFERSTDRPSAQAPRRSGAPTPVQPPAEPPMPVGRALPYSVAIAGYQLLDQAQERIDQLRNEQSSMQFYIAPTVVQGSLFYRVLAGPLPDSATAAAVRDTLVAKRIKTMTLASDLLATPYAFLIGTFNRRNEAQTKAAEATASGVPAYVVPVADTAGVTTYRVYAGAFSGQGDAQFLRESLKNAALPDSLVERTGSIRS